MISRFIKPSFAIAFLAIVLFAGYKVTEIHFEKSIANCLNADLNPDKVISYCSNLLDKADTVEGDYFRYLEARTIAYRKNKEFKKAIADLDHAKSLQPEKRFNLVLRGLINTDLGLTDIALDNFEKSLDPNLSKAVAIANRSWIFEYFGEFDLALMDIETSLSLDFATAEERDSHDGVLKFRLLQIALIQEKYGQALSAAQEALEVSPNSQRYLETIGMLHTFHTLNTQKAIQAYEAAYALAPDSATFLAIMAATYLRHNQQEQAMPLVEEYVRLKLKTDGEPYRDKQQKLTILARTYRSSVFNMGGRLDLAIAEVNNLVEDGYVIGLFDMFRKPIDLPVDQDVNWQTKRVWRKILEPTLDLFSLEILRKGARKFIIDNGLPADSILNDNLNY